jgi:hypothetical protein
MPKSGSKDHRDLPVPGDVTADPQAQELVRAWMADGRLVCCLRPDALDEAGMWGLVLADLARNLANAHYDSKGEDRAATLEAIRDLFNREIEAPTDEPVGQFLD